LLLILLSMTASAQDGPPFEWALPLAQSPVADECAEAVDLVVGQPVPPALIDSDGLVRCYATAVPTSDLASLLLVDAWAGRAAPRGAKAQLEMEWQQERYQRLADAFNAPTPVMQRPAAQRVLGRLETVGVMALAIGLYAVLDSQVVD